MNDTHVPQVPPPPASGPEKQPKKKMSRTKKIVLGGSGALLAGLITITAVTAGGDTAPADAEDAVATAPAEQAPATEKPAADQPAAEAPAAEVTPEKTQPAGPTVAQEQALRAAKNYLDSGMGFSRAGLIQQLTSEYGEGFAAADATWAVDHAGADWNAQAVAAAKNYMQSGMGFSRDGLIQQLTSEYGEQFTPEQAQYAATQVGL